MSIALNARIKDMERRLKELESAVDVLRAERVKMDALPVRVMASVDGFVDVGGGMEVDASALLRAEPGEIIPVTPKRGPGRPRKESNGS